MKNLQSDRDISVFFDRCARERLMVEFEPDEKEKLSRFIDAWELSPGHRVLEPGCGSGRLTRLLAESVGATGEIYACDLSPEMIRLAREREQHSQVHLICRPATQIDRGDNWFDRIICLNVFPHFLDKLAVLKEFARVLKPSGFLWINHFSSREALNHFHRHAAGEVSGHTLPCPTGMGMLMADAGLQILRLEDGEGEYILQAKILS